MATMASPGDRSQLAAFRGGNEGRGKKTAKGKRKGGFAAVSITGTQWCLYPPITRRADGNFSYHNGCGSCGYCVKRSMSTKGCCHCSSLFSDYLTSSLMSPNTFLEFVGIQSSTSLVTLYVQHLSPSPWWKCILSRFVLLKRSRVPNLP